MKDIGKKIIVLISSICISAGLVLTGVGVYVLIKEIIVNVLGSMTDAHPALIFSGSAGFLLMVLVIYLFLNERYGK